jgi:hypothetical protein
VLGCWSLVLLLCSTIHAQDSINERAIDDAGGTSTGGPMIGINYSVGGTIGRPDAGGPMTNGQCSVTGGFWALPTAMQVGGAPTLAIVSATPGHATISWTPATPGFAVQETLTFCLPTGPTRPVARSLLATATC